MVEPQGGSQERWSDECSGPHRFTARLLVGLALLGLGALWTLDNLGFTDAGEVTRFWPILLIVFGLAKILGWGARRSAFAGGMWLLAGFWLLLHALGIVRAGLAGVGSLALIVIGARFILFPGRTRFRHRMSRGFVEREGPGGRMRMEVFMSNARRQVEPGPFPGGEVSAVLSSAEIDLRGATLADGRVELDANAVMAGIELFVPHGWRVVNAVTAVLGTVEDHTERLPEGAAPGGTLYLKGAAVMGSIEIRN